MKKVNKILIIGHFGGNNNFLDGQTVKTKILYDELTKNTNWKIKKIDTYYKSKRPIKLLFDTFLGLVLYKNVIVLLSGNGMKFYFPILYFFSKFFKRNIYHDVIGGNLHIYVKENIKYKKYLNSFRYNWVETNKLKEELEKINIKNCIVIPNFKNLKIEENLEYRSNLKELKLCTFSRVMKEKGITDAINTVVELNKNAECKCCLDIYGPIEENYKDEFELLINLNDKYVKYCGTVLFDKSVEKLKKYDLLLFPTYWKGEGFPGTIIDAFSAGLPVIATDWNCNSEIVENYKTGIIYPNDKEKSLKDAILKVYNDNELFNNMRFNSTQSAKKYEPEKYIKKIINYIEGEV